MQDIYCTRCGEPWELDTFHDVAAETGVTFTEAVADFRRRGCVATGARQCERVNTLRTAASAAMFDLMGDDLDGVAAMMDDFEFFGMLDEDPS